MVNGRSKGGNKFTDNLESKQPANIFLTFVGKPLFKIFFILAAFLVLVFSWLYNAQEKLQTVHDNSLLYAHHPEIDDIYFLDYRLIGENLRSKQNFRVAKVIDITGDVVTMRYSELLFEFQNAAVNSIRYGQLRYDDYFQKARLNFNKNTLVQWVNSGAVYLIERPESGRLYGNFISPEKSIERMDPNTRGLREFESAQAYLDLEYDELAENKAFILLEKSANLDFDRAQILLAELYLSGIGTDKDKTQALYWFNKAALQSNEAAIHKYAIVCEQVDSCNVYDFYQQLFDYGVNIQVRNGRYNVKLD
ncbi:tetratricopeptide repeat protein [Thalassotalea marina]|uniref:Sel1 repeat family protein n=1 Tax=Thalassotalea marina TaxID=1673741 RepID=A0A919BNP6_9GAMM|nr:SEL1-like repeat protein [Thalassotalea marina]GHG02710.1 hypothetical protein GCM10017161_34570 [Thalassotalea marina]